ncbi:LacI family transcriptional regulator [Luteimicrobium album]|uniref:LacI family transcriptional regulator n=1 Tax=Luteimicrobium album TaxID=1054550 RepID=A0ABQ6HYB4_9MICO|nr:LacI family DNA-binding transcriptional regulator [Luteimicrobium album]GMA23499.1 LacI family transcriptional regulator [Luteimicrobium album]
MAERERTVSRRATLVDVARDAGVSLATASRTLNGSVDRVVGAELRARVLASAARLHYSPDANAQATARGRTTTIGLVVHDIADPYFAAIAAGVTAAADREGLVVTLASTGNDPGRELGFVELLDRQRARAVILAGARMGRGIADDTAGSDAGLGTALARYRERSGAVATIGQAVGDLPGVLVANRDGAAELARVVHDLGYRSFAILSGAGRNRSAADRVEGFVSALAGLGIDRASVAVVPSAFTRDGGYAGMRSLLESGTARPEVVLAANDVMAMGAITAARDLGLSVPRDVAVTGFDDVPSAVDVMPALTTVALPLARMGELAVGLALATPDGDAPARTTVTGVVRVRASTPRRP